MNLFFQRGIIQNKDGEYTQNPSNEQQYMFVIRAELKNKCTIHGRSRYLPKRQAEEEAAEHLISQIKPCLTNLKEGKLLFSKQRLFAWGCVLFLFVLAHDCILSRKKKK